MLVPLQPLAESVGQAGDPIEGSGGDDAPLSSQKDAMAFEYPRHVGDVAAPFVVEHDDEALPIC